MLIRRLPWLFLAAAAAAGAAGCRWSARSGLPDHIRTVSVPMFENRTGEYGLETALTEALRRAVIQDPRVRLVNGGADAVLSGGVTAVRRRPVREDRDDRPAAMQAVVVARFSFYDEAEGRWLVEDAEIDSAQASSARGLYSVAPSPRQRPEAPALDGAIEALAAEMARRTLGMW